MISDRMPSRTRNVDHTDDALFAIDVGGSRIKSSIVQAGTIRRLSIQEAVSGDAYHHLHQIRDLWERQGEGLPIGICWPGKLNSGCEPAELREAAGSALPIAVLTDDMIAAAHGEAEGRDIALLQIGTGVGAAMVRDGKAHKCIAGHIVFREQGLPDPSGMHGAVDAYLGWRSICRRLRDAGLPQPTGPAELLTLAERDPMAAEALEDALAAAGFVAAYLMACSGSERLVLAGGVAAAWGETLKTNIEETLSWRLWPDLAARIKVELSPTREQAPLKGLWRMYQEQIAGK